MTDEGLEPLARAVPTARADERRRSWTWLVPLLALAATVGLGLRERGERGSLLSIHAAEGHGIARGDPVRYRGIDVGQVASAELADDLSSVVIRVRLQRGAEGLARAGTRFWIVRPHLAVDQVAGLETIFGSRYLEALPAARGDSDGERQTDFVALAEPPVLEDVQPGGLELVLLAASRHGLDPGAALHYRGIAVGRVLSVGLASDAADVEVRVYVRAPYRQLVRKDTRFFLESGASFELGITGLEVGLDSLRSLVVGSIGMATPDAPGELVSTGHRFPLAEAPETKWLAWRPPLAVGNALLPFDAPAPSPLRATVSWKSERLFLERSHEQSAWVLVLGGALLGPAELLARPELDGGTDFELEVAGARFPLLPGPPGPPGASARAGAALLEGFEGIGIPWPRDFVRRPEAPEDCLVVGDPTAAPLALSAGRLSPSDDGWKVDRAYSIGPEWNGAPVFARSDGRLVGILLAADGRARVAPLPESS